MRRTARTGTPPLLPLLLLLLTLVLSAVVAQVQDKGHQYRRPSRNSRVAIVGAGPSGLHMAYLLRSLGFHDLLVVEATSRVGGRSVTLQDEAEPGLVHEMGTTYLTSDYAEFRQMATNMRYDLEEVTLPEAVLHMSLSANDRDPVLLRQFLIDRIRSVDPGLSKAAPIEAVVKRIRGAVSRYVAIRSKFFPPSRHSSYLEFSMTPPPTAALAQLNCTVGQFLMDNNLMALEPYFLLAMTGMGYGNILDTSILYGFMWMTPIFWRDLLAPSRNATGMAMLRRGFGGFWNASRDQLEAAGGVQFRLGRQVHRVSRPLVGAVNPGLNPVQLLLDDGSLESVDWLVWTPGVHWSAIAAFEDLTAAEASAFAGLSAREFRTRLVRLPGEPAAAVNAVSSYLHVLDKEWHSIGQLLSVRNSAKILQPHRKNATTSTLVAYYLSDSGDASDSDDLCENGDGCQNDLQDGEILAEMTFHYSPQHSVSDIAAGVLWRTLSDEVQGARRTWFAGHSVVFDTVKSVMKYNKMLLLSAFPELADQLARL